MFVSNTSTCRMYNDYIGFYVFLFVLFCVFFLRSLLTPEFYDCYMAFEA